MHQVDSFNASCTSFEVCEPLMMRCLSETSSVSHGALLGWTDLCHKECSFGLSSVFRGLAVTLGASLKVPGVRSLVTKYTQVTPCFPHSESMPCTHTAITKDPWCEISGDKETQAG